MQITIKPFAMGHETSVVELLKRTMTAEHFSMERFVKQVLLDPNFDVDGALVADVFDKSENSVAGFCLSIARKVPLENAPSDGDRGYITLMGVAPEYQRQGIWSQLLEKAEDYLRQQGRKTVWISPYAPGYFIPGVDVQAYEQSLNFFKKHGYQEVYRPLAMEASLWNLETPEWVRQKERELEPNEDDQISVHIGPYFWRYLLPLMEFVKSEFPGDWVRVARETANRILSGESEHRMYLALEFNDNDNTCRVLGFSHFENERFGPIGVASSERGRGIGQILMYRTLHAQREAGFKTSFFLWTDDKTAERFYAPAGYKEVRRFAVLKKEL